MPLCSTVAISKSASPSLHSLCPPFPIATSRRRCASRACVSLAMAPDVIQSILPYFLTSPIYHPTLEVSQLGLRPVAVGRYSCPAPIASAHQANAFRTRDSDVRPRR